MTKSPSIQDEIKRIRKLVGRLGTRIVIENEPCSPWRAAGIHNGGDPTCDLYKASVLHANMGCILLRTGVWTREQALGDTPEEALALVRKTIEERWLKQAIDT